MFTARLKTGRTGGTFSNSLQMSIARGRRKSWTNSAMADRKYPMANFVAEAAAGNLYGTTRYGGKYNGGMIFEVTP
jgi:uncharacterized repeat protein (TIGR03803 family)